MTLEPSEGVPDALYVTLHSRLFELEPGAVAPQELAAARVLRVHRDWLNGGFDQTLGNLESSDQPLADYVQAYLDIGLADAARLVGQAASEWPPDVSLDDEGDSAPYEQLDESYLRLTYPDDELPDRIEAAVVEFIASHLQAFSEAIAEGES